MGVLVAVPPRLNVSWNWIVLNFMPDGVEESGPKSNVVVRGSVALTIVPSVTNEPKSMAYFTTTVSLEDVSSVSIRKRRASLSLFT